MKTINVSFFLNQATFFKNFLPLAIEARKRNLPVTFFVESSGKYNDVMLRENFNELANFSKNNNCNIQLLSEVRSWIGPGLSFFHEGVMLEKCNPEDIKVVATNSADFMLRYGGYENYYPGEGYISRVDKVILPSIDFAKMTGTISKKNLYHGLPKYEVLDEIEKNRKTTLQKYGLISVNKKIALLFYPKLRDHKKIRIPDIIKTLKEAGYFVVVKSRGKDRPPEYNSIEDVYFEDVSYYPHTSLELLTLADLVVNFSSTCIKECIMTKKPVINYDTKPFEKIFKELYEYDFAIEMVEDKNNINFVKEDLEAAIKSIEKKTSFQFEECIEKYFANSRFGASKKIFDDLLK